MSFEEKSTWIMLLVGPAAFIAYLINVLPQLANAPVTDIAYEKPLVIAIVAAIVAIIICHIVVAAASPEDADKRDERDVFFDRRGHYVGGFVLAIGAVFAMSLALMKFEHFWIANSIYVSCVLMDMTAQIVRLVGYRRGF